MNSLSIKNKNTSEIGAVGIVMYKRYPSLKKLRQLVWSMRKTVVPLKLEEKREFVVKMKFNNVTT